MQWRTIESAPKDSRILAYDPETGGQHVVYWVAAFSDFVPVGWDIYGDSITVSHWMPLPDPPAAPLSHFASSNDAGKRDNQCIGCANGNDLPDGEYCRACGREGRATGLGAAVIRARGRQEPPTVPVTFDGPTEATKCPACGALIYPADKVPCGVSGCAGRMTADLALSYIRGGI
jgi:hypothetical protein